MRVEIWSDIVCPWCYIGKRRFEKALARFDHSDEIEGVWRSFQLHPEHPKGVREPLEESLASKLGGSVEQVRAMNDRVKALATTEGLDYDFESYTLVNTFDAHRLAHQAKSAPTRCRVARAYPSGAADRGRGSRRRGHAGPTVR